MTDDRKIYVDQVGCEFRLDADPPAEDGKWYEADGITERDPIDISGASVFKILVLKPSGSEVEWLAAQYLATTKITYTTIAGDLDGIGKYKFQAYLEWADPVIKVPGETCIKKVYARFK